MDGKNLHPFLFTTTIASWWIASRESQGAKERNYCLIYYAIDVFNAVIYIYPGGNGKNDQNVYAFCFHSLEARQLQPSLIA